MKEEKHRRDVEKELYNAMKRDKARTKILRMSQFGIVQMTRQRMRTSVPRATFATCPRCSGTGQVRTLESITINLMRKIKTEIARKDLLELECHLHPDVALHVLNQKRAPLLDLERQLNKRITVKSNNALEFQEIQLFRVQGSQTVKL